MVPISIATSLKHDDIVYAVDGCSRDMTISIRGQNVALLVGYFRASSSAGSVLRSMRGGVSLCMILT